MTDLKAAVPIASSALEPLGVVVVSALNASTNMGSSDYMGSSDMGSIDASGLTQGLSMASIIASSTLGYAEGEHAGVHPSQPQPCALQLFVIRSP